MPKPNEGESQKEFVTRCIPIVLEDGTAKDNEQAAAVCYSMWQERDKGKAMSLSVTLKTDPTSGRVRWKAIANSGEFDQQGDRFDESFFDDIVKNFWAVQDAVSRGEAVPAGFAHPDGMPVPQLDVAHYSFQLQRSDRIKARAGVPTFAYRDGHKLILQGHFETTPLGSAASKSVLSDESDIIKTSIGVWPDWNHVETLPDNRRVFKGGAGLAYLDHLALTAHPVDAGAEIEAEGQMAKSLKVQDDALEVLKDEKLVADLEAARSAQKSEAPTGALAKANEPPAAPVAESVVTVTHETTTKDVTTIEKDKTADAVDAQAAQLAAQAVASPAPEPQAEPMADSLAIARAITQTRSVLSNAIKALGERLDVLEKSVPNMGAIQDLATALNKSIEATQLSEAQKVKAMLDNRGWLDIAKLYSARSATDNTVDGGARAKGPQEALPLEVAGGPIAGRFLRT